MTVLIANVAAALLLGAYLDSVTAGLGIGAALYTLMPYRYSAKS